MTQQTLMMIKPDAVERGLIGQILARVEEGDLRISRLKMIHLTPEEARSFYHVHADKPFIDELVAFMSRSPIVACVLEGEEAVLYLRAIMGATDPSTADAGTIRASFALSIQENSVHGSDSPESASSEIEFFSLGMTRSG